MTDHDKPQEPSWKTSLPFPRRWLYYIVLKLCVLAIVVLVVLRLKDLI
jgi:hypothetical protein